MIETEELLRPSLVDPRLGQVLSGRYRIEKKLGEGGMGVVYAGTHLLIKRRVAIKMLHPQFAQDPAVVARFQREAQSATAIGHPHIVEVFDMGNTPDGAVFMVLEFLDGQDFAHLLEASSGPLPLGRASRILAQVADALSAAHEAKIVHRDLKPENVFLVKRGEDPDFVKLVDFGISKMLDDGEGQVNKGLTRTGAAMGTPYYMPPEQIEGRKTIDHRADLYALGVMAYRALSGVFPFDADTLPMLMMRVLTTAPTSIASYRPDLPMDIVQLIDGLLAKDPAARPESAKAVRAIFLLHEAHSQSPVLVNAPNPPGIVSAASFAETAMAPAAPHALAAPSRPEFQVSSVPRSSRRWVVALVAIISATTAGALWMQRGDGAEVAESTRNPEVALPATRNPEVAHPITPNPIISIAPEVPAETPRDVPQVPATLPSSEPDEHPIVRDRIRRPAAAVTEHTTAAASAPEPLPPLAPSVAATPSEPLQATTEAAPRGVSSAVKNPFARPHTTP